MNSWTSTQSKNGLLAGAERFPAEAKETSVVRLIPQETYGDEVLALLERKSQDGIAILQFNFFTDNKENTYPKRIASKLMDIRKQKPQAPILVALEGRKDAGNTDGRGASQRNAKTKKLLNGVGIDVHDVYGHSGNLQNPQAQKDGVSHTKLVMAGNEVIAGSSNLTMQSTNVGANNEMNIAVESEKIATVVLSYVNQIVTNPGQMVDLEVEDGGVRLLTDRLHFAELLGQIRTAQKGDQLGLSMYQFLYRNENDQQAKQVLEELIAAHRRGVQLEIYLNRAEDLATQNTSANLRVAELFLQEGVHKVYFDPVAKISHSKFLYRISGNEKVALISSVNIYKGDFNDNHQLTWVVKKDNLVDQLVTYFKHQIAYDGILVSRIQKNASTGLRYKIVSDNPEKTEWNPVVPSQRMLRFWRGFKQDNVSRDTFEAKVNTKLIPETIEVGSGRGLTAYLPSFFSGDKPDFIPDEVAIVGYADEEKYNAIRTTERGRKYGPLHFEEGLFAKQNAKGFSSGSLVGSIYTGEIEIKPEGRAYVLGSPDLNWQDGVTARRTLLPTRGLSSINVQQYLSSIQDGILSMGLIGAVAIVDPKYILLMFNLKDQTAADNLDAKITALESGVFSKLDHIILNNQMHGATDLRSGAGINVKFEYEVKPRAVLMDTVLREIGSKAVRANSCQKFYGN